VIEEDQDGEEEGGIGYIRRRKGERREARKWRRK
jgi:hypothetical protein